MDWALRLLEIYQAYDQGKHLIGIQKLALLEAHGDITTTVQN